MPDNSVDFLSEKFDVVFFDSVGTPYIGSSPRHGPLGGSEFQTILCAEGLAKAGLKVLCINNIPFVAKQNDVLYIPAETLSFQSVKTKNLITLRNSQLPDKYVEFEKHFVWATDLPGPHYDVVNSLLAARPETTLITVSNWHNNLFGSHLNKRFIYNQIPDEVYDVKSSKSRDFTKFIYASAAQKGLNQTVDFFKMLKKDYFFKKTELVVLSPGYDQPSKEALNNKINYKGGLPFHNVVKELATANAMLYCNTLPETFGISCVLAEIVGAVPFVLYSDHAGALPEVLNSPYVGANPEMMYSDLLEYAKNPKKVEPKNFRSSKIMPLWREILKV